MNSRLKEINLFIDSIKTKKQYEDELKSKLDTFQKKFSKELKNYKPVTSLVELNNLKKAGYIRYVNLDGEIKYGGILIKVFKSDSKDEFNQKTLIILQNSEGIKWTISWEKNYIFYKKQTKKGDNIRNLFISLLDNDNKN